MSENKTNSVAESQPLGILRFEPCFHSLRWGGTQLASYKGIAYDSADNIAESWEISGLKGSETTVSEGRFKGLTVTDLMSRYGLQLMGEKLYARYGNFFPLLIKFIDAADDLSIQVHPDNEQAPDGLGKTELWYIIKSEPGSYIYSGFNRPLSRETLLQSIEKNSLVDMLAKHFSEPGDVFYLPAGRIHSIGAGNMLLEVQQTSATTYRLHDYRRKDKNGKLRELHIDKAVEVIDYDQTDYGLARPQMLIDCETRVRKTPFFTITSAQIMSSLRMEVAAHQSPRILIAIAGSGTVRDSFGESKSIRQGQTLMIPAETQYVDITSQSTPFKLISVYIE